jgi:hypothetical protein
MPLGPLPSLLELLDLFERAHHPVLCSDGQRLRGVPAWDLKTLQHLSPAQVDAWTDCIGYAGSYPAPHGDDLVPVDLDEDEATGGFRYRCPTTFRRKTLSAAAVAVYALRVAPLLHAIADLLGIALALRAGVDAPHVEGTLWHLGRVKIGPAHTGVWVVRGLAQDLEAVFQRLYAPDLPDHGLVLSCGAVLPDGFVLPRHYRFVRIDTVIMQGPGGPCFDFSHLQRLLGTASTRPALGAAVVELPVRFDEHASTLTIRGNPKPWHIKGSRQAAAVRYLVDQAHKDRWQVDAAEILAAAYPDLPAGKSRRMQNLFSGNEEWKEYIDNPEKGRYALRIG